MSFTYLHKGDLNIEKDLACDNVSKDHVQPHGAVARGEKSEEMYGTWHVLVLADFPSSTKTTDLEKLLQDFKDRGVVIHWVNDTVALAVFKLPSIVLEASTCLQCRLTVRILDENDELLTSIPPKDLEPPRPRPGRTAQRLIAQGVGIKLPSTSLGSREVRKQEEAARKNRIVAIQHMRDGARGDDVNWQKFRSSTSYLMNLMWIFLRISI